MVVVVIQDLLEMETSVNISRLRQFICPSWLKYLSVTCFGNISVTSN